MLESMANDGSVLGFPTNFRDSVSEEYRIVNLMTDWVLKCTIGVHVGLETTSLTLPAFLAFGAAELT